MNSKCLDCSVVQQWPNAGMLKGRWDNPCLDGKIAKMTGYW